MAASERERIFEALFAVMMFNMFGSLHIVHDCIVYDLYMGRCASRQQQTIKSRTIFFL
jgi:hypothetical protein